MSTQKTLVWSVIGMEGADMNGKSDIGSNGCPNYELLLNHRREVWGGEGLSYKYCLICYYQ